jgi:hypothetical protein
MHQYAHFGHGRSIHSAAQLKWYQNDVSDCSVKVPGGLQWITTPDVYTIPINVIDRLPFIWMQPYRDDEWDPLPHVVLTLDVDWDPIVHSQHVLDGDNFWYDAVATRVGKQPIYQSL